MLPAIRQAAEALAQSHAHIRTHTRAHTHTRTKAYMCACFELRRSGMQRERSRSEFGLKMCIRRRSKAGCKERCETGSVFDNNTMMRPSNAVASVSHSHSASAQGGGGIVYSQGRAPIPSNPFLFCQITSCLMQVPLLEKRKMDPFEVKPLGMASAASLV